MSFDAGTLVRDVVQVARAKGLDQAALARAAGVAPETISRAKRRGNIELRTLASLATAAGAVLSVQPEEVPLRSPHAEPRPSTLADASWGLAWSNPNMPVESLISSALVSGRYDAILEAVAQHGMPLVRRQWEALESARPARLSKRASASVERMLTNIRKGFARAQG